MSNVIYEVVITQNPVFEIVVNNGAKGNGVIPGGLTNQVLVKKSNSDYDTMWVTASVVTPVDSVNGQVGDVVLDYEDVGASPVGHTHTDKMDIDGLNSDIDTLNFQTDITRAVVEGQISYNATQRTFNGGLGNDVIGSFFQETYYPDTKNKDSVTITNGSLVQYDGAIGNSGVIKIKRCATNVALAGAIMGIATEDIGVNKLGKVTWFGKVSGIQTDGANYGETWVDGDMLYNSTTVAGGLSKVKPVAPSNASFIGIVVNAHNSNGQLLIRPMFFPTLGQLSNVYTNGGASDGQVLVYDFANSRWHNSTLDSTQVAYGDGNVSEALGVRYTKTETDTLLGNKVDKVAGKSLVSDTVITDLTDGGDTTLHTHKSIVNEVSVDNAKVEALATGGRISRNIADSNHALVVDLMNASATGNISQFRWQSATKATISKDGNVGSPMIHNLNLANNSKLELLDTGLKATRNIADANPALIVNQANASSTGNILDLQFGGVQKLGISSTGRINTATGMANSATSNNAYIEVSTTGGLIQRNVADSNSALRINQQHASSTGLITDFQFGGVSKATVDNTGNIYSANVFRSNVGLRNHNNSNNALINTFDAGAKISRNVADANPSLIVDLVHASSKGLILDLQAQGVSKASVDKDGIIKIGTKTPSSATDTGVAGQIAWDANYIYVCTATNTWKRVAIATW